jgi:hypothetical protein
MNHTMFPQTLLGTSADWLKVAASVGNANERIVHHDARTGSRRSEGVPVREPLWTVEFEGQRISCELRYHGKYGVEYRLFRDNEFYQGRGFRTREPALLAATVVRRQLEADGWVG